MISTAAINSVTAFASSPSIRYPDGVMTVTVRNSDESRLFRGLRTVTVGDFSSTTLIGRNEDGLFQVVIEPYGIPVRSAIFTKLRPSDLSSKTRDFTDSGQGPRSDGTSALYCSQICESSPKISSARSATGNLLAARFYAGLNHSGIHGLCPAYGKPSAYELSRIRSGAVAGIQCGGNFSINL